MPPGDDARYRAAELLDSMKRGEHVIWSVDRHHVFTDGTSLKLEVEREPSTFHGPGHTRTVLFDANGTEVDATEWFADPPMRIAGTSIPALRALVDKYLTEQRA